MHYKANDVEVDKHLAFNLNSPLTLLSLLSESGMAYIRESVACNPATPDGLLMDLAEDEAESVRYGVIGNPNVGALTLEAAKNYPDSTP